MKLVETFGVEIDISTERQLTFVMDFIPSVAEILKGKLCKRLSADDLKGTSYCSSTSLFWY